MVSTCSVSVADSPDGVSVSTARRAGRLLPVLLLLVVGVLVAGWFAGFRVFVIDTPSMGQAAPVGSLVVGGPPGTIRVGDVVTYRAPDGAGTYTHRVVRVGADGMRTRGDINGVDDPWVVSRSMLVTSALLVVPGIGWLVRSAPYIAIGWALVAIGGRLTRSRDRRTEVRLIGGAAIVGVVAVVFRPFTGYVVLHSVVQDGGLHASIVSTALLPITLAAQRGGELRLAPGQIGELLLPGDAAGRVMMTTSLDLDPVGWVGLVGLCLVPIVWTLCRARRASPAPGAGERPSSARAR